MGINGDYNGNNQVVLEDIKLHLSDPKRFEELLRATRREMDAKITEPFYLRELNEFYLLHYLLFQFQIQ